MNQIASKCVLWGLVLLMVIESPNLWSSSLANVSPECYKYLVTAPKVGALQNQCLRAFTGAFRSAQSLCVEIGILSLEYTRDVILKFSKIQAHPHTLTSVMTLGDLHEGI